MELVLIFLGPLLIDLGFRGTEHEFAAQLGKDFGGTKFWAWVALVVIIGAIGYYPPAKKVSNLGLALVSVGFVFSNTGAISQFSQVASNPPAPASSVPLPQLQQSSSGSGGGSGSSDAQYAQYAEYAALLA
jgi:hypothetical protein